MEMTRILTIATTDDDALFDWFVDSVFGPDGVFGIGAEWGTWCIALGCIAPGCPIGTMFMKLLILSFFFIAQNRKTNE